MAGYQSEPSLPTEVTWLVGDVTQRARTQYNNGLTSRRIVAVQGLACMQNLTLYLKHEIGTYEDVKSLLPVLTAVETLVTASRVLLVNKPLEIPGYPDVTLLINLEFN